MNEDELWLYGFAAGVVFGVLIGYVFGLLVGQSN